MCLSFCLPLCIPPPLPSAPAHEAWRGGHLHGPPRHQLADHDRLLPGTAAMPSRYHCHTIRVLLSYHPGITVGKNRIWAFKLSQNVRKRYLYYDDHPPHQSVLDLCLRCFLIPLHWRVSSHLISSHLISPLLILPSLAVHPWHRAHQGGLQSCHVDARDLHSRRHGETWH